jgi:hypothetical protein
MKTFTQEEQEAMAALFSLVKQSQGEYRIFFENGTYVGDAVLNDDGMYLYFPAESKNGGTPAYGLIGMGLVLAQLNVFQEEQERRYFDEHYID